MREMRLVTGSVFALFACDSAEHKPLLTAVIEHQPSYLEDVAAEQWQVGSAIVVLDQPVFPQPVSIRCTLLEHSTSGGAEPAALRSFSTQIYGGIGNLVKRTGARCAYPLPDEGATHCLGDFSVNAPGGSVLAISVLGIEDVVTSCFYYAVVDSSADVESLRTQLEANAEECRNRIPR